MGSAVYMTGELSQPCSNSGMIHHECGGWFLASVLSPCTYSWKSTCQVDAMHEQNSKATVFAVDVEMAVVDKAVCGASSTGACKKMDVNPTSGVKTKCDPVSMSMRSTLTTARTTKVSMSMRSTLTTARTTKVSMSTRSTLTTARTTTTIAPPD